MRASIAQTHNGEMTDHIVIPTGDGFLRQAQAVLYHLHQPWFDTAQNSARFPQRSRLATETRLVKSHHCLLLHRSIYLSQHQYPVVVVLGLHIHTPVPFLVVMIMIPTEDNRTAVCHQWYQVLVQPHRLLVPYVQGGT
jgi:aspartyl/asparaginyl beta-hydroxylase (cupin superfamily)